MEFKDNFKQALIQAEIIKDLNKEIDSRCKGLDIVCNSTYDTIINHIIKEITKNYINRKRDTYVFMDKIYTSGCMVLYNTNIARLDATGLKVDKGVLDNQLFTEGYLDKDPIYHGNYHVGWIIFVTEKGYELIKEDNAEKSV